MSRYFDKRQQMVREDFSIINQVEALVIEAVNLVTGDIEFPAKMREKIHGIIAENIHDTGEYGCMTNGGRISDIIQESRLIVELHSAFHDLASMRVKTRFGKLCDQPDKILKRRQAFIEA